MIDKFRCDSISWVGGMLGESQGEVTPVWFCNTKQLHMIQQSSSYVWLNETIDYWHSFIINKPPSQRRLLPCQAHKFVWLLSSNHRCVLWPVDQWECSIFVDLNFWALLYDIHGYYTWMGNVCVCPAFYGQSAVRKIILHPFHYFYLQGTYYPTGCC